MNQSATRDRKTEDGLFNFFPELAGWVQDVYGGVMQVEKIEAELLYRCREAAFVQIHINLVVPGLQIANDRHRRQETYSFRQNKAFARLLFLNMPQT